MWKNVVESDTTGDNIIWSTGFACWIIKATDIHSEYVMFIAFSMATMVIRTCLIVSFVRVSPVLLISILTPNFQTFY